MAVPRSVPRSVPRRVPDRAVQDVPGGSTWATLPQMLPPGTKQWKMRTRSSEVPLEWTGRGTGAAEVNTSHGEMMTGRQAEAGPEETSGSDW